MPSPNDELDTLVVKVRADTSGFASGVADIRAQLDGPLASGVDAAGRNLERSLARAVVGGKFGFDDLKRVALAALADIASAAVRSDLRALTGGGDTGGGLLGTLASAAASLFGGAPGRATGGPVTGGNAYLVGERGPEVFVPTAAGRIQPLGQGRGAVSVTVNVAAPREASPATMQRTGAQVARAVSRALEKAQN